MKSINDYKIRRITPDDYLGLHNVYFLTWLDTYPNKKFNITVEDIKYKYEQRLLPKTIEERKKKILEKRENEINLLVEYKGEIIALCNGVKNVDYNELQAIYVLPKYQRLGLGHVLWEEAKKFFDSKKNIVVHVASYNKKAINFYEKIGFIKTGKIFSDEKHKMRNGAIIPEAEMIIKR